MTPEEAFDKAKKRYIGDDIVIKSVEDAWQLHKQLLELRTHLIWDLGLIDIMPHYRGEQKYGWDIRSGIFRPPLDLTNPATGKDLELKGIREFEQVITEKIGSSTLRELFNKEKHGKDWDLLMQAQHAGIRTTLTDWSADIISALFFASESSTDDEVEKSDGQLWTLLVPTDNIMGHNNYPERRTFYDLDPFNLEGTLLINPSAYLDNIDQRIFEYRMFKQKGRFIMPSKDTCNVPLNLQEDLKKLIIRVRVPAEFKQSVRDELAKLDTTRSSMYIDENPKRQGLITEINNKIFKEYNS